MNRPSDLDPAPPRRTGPTAVDAESIPVRRRPTTWIAVALLVLALAMVGFMFATAVLPGHERLSTRVDGLADVVTIVPSLAAFVSLPTVGAILAIRRPSHPIGWVLLVGGVTLILGDFSQAYAERSIKVDPALPGYRLLDWLAPPLAALALPLLTVWLPLLFPDGRLPGSRWWIVGLIAAINLVGSVALALVTLDDDLSDALSTLMEVLSGGLIVAALGAVIVRLRRSRGAERQQMKWFVAAVGLVVVAIFALAVETSVLGWSFFMSAIALLPIAIGIAVLRYRLYEIDRLISRTIGWAIVTGLLVGAFVLLVLGLTSVVEPLFGGGNTLAIAGSTLVVAALFNPVRTRVQRAVDRRFDRGRYDGERLLAALGERLRDEVDLGTISADVLATVDAAVRPTAAGLWLRERAGERHTRSAEPSS